jgi:uncharacterized protein with HEPN domain
MRKNKIQARLDDILEAIAGIERMLEGVTFDAFAATWHLQRATERGLEIISEASRSIPTEMRALEPEVPWPQIVSIGNLLRHEYQRVEPLIVWNIVEEHLAQLRFAIGRLVSYLENESKS